MAAGGEGAPLTPAFHRAVFTDFRENRAIINIGGIANITYLPSRNNTNEKCFGFDCGPGNVLMDQWINLHRRQGFDENGDWARSGRVSNELLTRLMLDDYLQRPPPKSTGREHYHMPWLNRQLQGFGDVPTESVQATLCEFTALGISHAISDYLPAVDRIMICGGGAHNRYLLERLQYHQKKTPVESTQAHGLHPDWVEAVAFAWLAKQALEGRKTDLMDITGASENQILGAIYAADQQ
jgi:anhydro-N-acetylmuramic acid kinase